MAKIESQKVKARDGRRRLNRFRSDFTNHNIYEFSIKTLHGKLKYFRCEVEKTRVGMAKFHRSQEIEYNHKVNLMKCEVRSNEDR